MTPKISVSLILLIFFSLKLFAQMPAQLCKVNEVVVSAFQLQNNKWVSVCKEKKEGYIVYRLGTADKAELQYPVVLDTTSWQNFSFTSYARDFGKQDVAMQIAYLDFHCNVSKYEVYETTDAEIKQENCGLKTGKGDAVVDMAGVFKTRIGNLLELKDNIKIKH
jgi:hypothetical protein